MKAILGSRRDQSLIRLSIFLITAALIAGMGGCPSSSQNLEIRTWYDLAAVTNTCISTALTSVVHVLWDFSVLLMKGVSSRM